MSSSVDKFGRDYKQLLARQTDELAHWKTILRPEVYEAMKGWCEMINAPAKPLPPRTPYIAGGLHTVPINQELHHFLMGYGRRGKKFSAVDRVPLDSELL